MAAPDIALLVAAHGSRAPGWGRPVAALAEAVRAEPGVAASFASVDHAFLEGRGPAIADVARRVLDDGARGVVVVPLFLTASSHVGEDLPAVLGMPGSERARERLAAAGVPLLPPGLPVTLAGLGPTDAVLGDNVVRRLAPHESAPGRAAVVLCAYGLSQHGPAWARLLDGVARRLREAGYAGVERAWVGHVVGLSPAPTRAAIGRAAAGAGVERVHVVPLLVSVSRLQSEVIAPAVFDARAAPSVTAAVSYAGDAILPDPALAARVVAAARAHLGSGGASGLTWASADPRIRP